MNTKIIRDNSGKEEEVYVNLIPGQKIICIKSLRGLGGDFMPFPMELLTKDKIYKIDRLSNWSFYGKIPWIIDEDGNSTWVTTEYFNLVD